MESATPTCMYHVKFNTIWFRISVLSYVQKSAQKYYAMMPIFTNPSKVQSKDQKLHDKLLI